MTAAETIKDAAGLGGSGLGRTSPLWVAMQACTDPIAASVSREAMAEARLPLAARDSCAHLLIPLNRCRHDSLYLPWKCEVCLVAESEDEPTIDRFVV